MDIPSLVRPGVSLKEYTTLHVGGPAEYLAEVSTYDELRSVVAWAENKCLPMWILGGGSNVIVSDDGVDGLVIIPSFKEISYQEKEGVTYVTVGSGVVFDALIESVVANGLWGLENLSAIPGTVGGVPIQNVGAYGVEAKDVLKSVTVFDLNTHETRVLDCEACMFGYRTSFFKTDVGRDLVVVDVTFRLHKEGRPNITYRDLAAHFGNTTPSLQAIRNAVIHIRADKFPDWHTLGTAGSFFKNPIIPATHFYDLVTRFPELPGFPLEGESVKISLGWILDKVLNRKGYREGQVGLYEKQALVLVNYGDATADEVLVFSEKIMNEIFNVTGVVVEREVVSFRK